MTWGYPMIQSKLKLRTNRHTSPAGRVSQNRNKLLGDLWFRHIRARLEVGEPPSERWPPQPEQQTFPWS
jgi:hypothetical protein